jgi:hypothetical protein
MFIVKCKANLVEFMKSFSLTFLALSLSIELINLSLKPPRTQVLALFDNIFFSWILISISILYIIFLTCSKKLTKPDTLGILLAVVALGFLKTDSFRSLFDFPLLIAGHYLDFKFPFLSFIALMVTTIFSFRQSTKACPQKEPNSTNSSSEQEEHYGRKEFAQKFLDMILKPNSNDKLKDEAEIFGLQASWGSGKTKTIEFIKEYAENMYKDKLLLIDFNPWYCTDSSQIASEFISVLKEKLKKRFPLRSLVLDSNLERYKNLLNTQYQSAFTFLFNLEGSREHEFKEINKHLPEIIQDKQILIIIDDIDRLEAAECIKTLQLVRQIASFKKIKFIIAYDKDHLHRVLKESALDLKYLDKIFPNEIDLPLIPERHLVEMLVNKLHIPKKIKEKITNKINQENDDSGTLSREVKLSRILSKEIKTFRDLEKLSQSFNNAYGFLGDNVDPYDLLVLKLLDLNYHDVYQTLKEKRSEYLDSPKPSSRIDITYYLKVELNLQKDPKKLLEYLFDKTQPEEDSIFEIAHNQSISSLGLRKFYSFELYFSLGYNYENSKIKPSEFKEFINSPSLENLDKKLKEYCSEEKYSSFLMLLRDLYLTDITEVYEKFFAVIFLTSAQPLFRAFTDQCFMAELLSRRLLSQQFDQEREDLQRKIQDSLWQRLQEHKGKQINSHLFILIFLNQFSIDLDTYDYAGIEYNYYFAPSSDCLLNFINEVFKAYLDTKEIFSSESLFVIISIAQRFLKENALFILREKLNTDKDFFKLFLEYLIGSYTQDDGENKSCWIMSCFYQNLEPWAEYQIDSAFKDLRALKNFIKSIDNWQNEDFTQEYFKFADEDASAGDKSISFSFQYLSPKASPD